MNAETILGTSYVPYVMGAVAIGVLYVIYYHLNQITARKGEPSMLFTAIPLIGHTLDYASRPYEFLKECKDKTNEIFGMLLGGNRTFIVHDPRSSYLIIQHTKELSVSEFFDMVLWNFFNTPTTLTHSPHYNEDVLRKMYTPLLLSDKSLNVFCVRMMKKFKHLYDFKVAPLLKEGASGKPVKLYELVGQFMFNVAIGSLFDSSVNDTPEKCDKLYAAFNDFDKALALSLGGIHLKYQRKAYRGLQYLTEQVSGVFTNNSDLMKKRNDYWDSVAEKDSNFMNKQATLNLPLLWASSANSVPATFWLIYYLLQQPEHMDRVMREIREHVPNHRQFLAENFNGEVDFENMITMDQLNKLNFLDACFNETLRLCSGSFLMRVVKTEGLTVKFASGNTYSFRKGDRVGLSTGLYHTNENLFPNPNQFDPFRWYSEDASPEERMAAAYGKIPMKYQGEDINS